MHCEGDGLVSACVDVFVCVWLSVCVAVCARACMYICAYVSPSRFLSCRCWTSRGRVSTELRGTGKQRRRIGNTLWVNACNMCACAIDYVYLYVSINHPAVFCRAGAGRLGWKLRRNSAVLTKCMVRGTDWCGCVRFLFSIMCTFATVTFGSTYLFETTEMSVRVRVCTYAPMHHPAVFCRADAGRFGGEW